MHRTPQFRNFKLHITLQRYIPVSIHTAIVMRKYEMCISVILNFYKKRKLRRYGEEYNSGIFDYLIQLASIVNLIIKKEIKPGLAFEME